MEISNIRNNAFNVLMDSLPENEETYEIKVIATLEDGSTLESTKQVTAQAIPINKVVCTGVDSITDYNSHAYVLNYSRTDDQTPNIGVMRVDSITTDNAKVKASNITKEGFNITVTNGSNLPNKQITITIVVVLQNGSRITIEKVITVNTITLNSVSISGPDEIDDSGDYNFTFEYDPNSNYVTDVEIIVEKIDNTVVDLGLPSGLLWRKFNLGATKEEEYGKFFMWGDTEGEDMTDKSAPTRNYGWNLYDTQLYGRNKLETDITPDSGFDAAQVNLGGQYRMPTKDDFKELYDNTTQEWTTINGIAGYKFISKLDSNKYIFIPAAGHLYGSSQDYRGSRGYYWSSSRYSSDSRYNLYFASNGVNPQSYNGRYYGFSIRPVLDSSLTPAPNPNEPINPENTPTTTVDLNLPSGNLWMTHNIGAANIEDTGYYFMWGDQDGESMIGKTTPTRLYNFDTYDQEGYSRTKLTTDIASNSEYDTVRCNVAGFYKLPTSADFSELYNNTTQEWTSINGVHGTKFVSKTDSSKFIFLPWGGSLEGSSHENKDTIGYYWSSIKSNNDNAHCLFISNFVTTPSYTKERCHGVNVRGIIKSNN